MPAIAVAPFVLKDAQFAVALDNYESHTSQVEFVPTTQQLQWQGLTPAASFTDVGSPSWAATVELALTLTVSTGSAMPSRSRAESSATITLTSGPPNRVRAGPPPAAAESARSP